jgi:hypothetical protein
MIGAIFRLFIFVLVLAALGILFFYAFIAALILTPILFVLFYLFGRKQNVQWWVVRNGGTDPRPRGHGPAQGPIIDHDPDALPPKEGEPR